MRDGLLLLCIHLIDYCYLGIRVAYRWALFGLTFMAQKLKFRFIVFPVVRSQAWDEIFCKVLNNGFLRITLRYLLSVRTYLARTIGPDAYFLKLATKLNPAAI